MCWKNDLTLLIGWGNEVKVCEIRTRQARDPRDLPMKYVEISMLTPTTTCDELCLRYLSTNIDFFTAQMFKTDYYICGIAPFSDGNIVLLTYDDPVPDATVIWSILYPDMLTWFNLPHGCLQSKKVKNPRPHVRFVEPGMSQSHEKSNDALGIKGYEKYRCDLYALGRCTRADLL